MIGYQWNVQSILSDTYLYIYVCYLLKAIILSVDIYIYHNYIQNKQDDGEILTEVCRET